MNKKQILMIICLVVCVIISFSVVSASENIDNQTASIDDDQSDLSQNDDNRAELSHGDVDNLTFDNNEILGDEPPGTFSDLYLKIGDPYVQDGDEINLNRDYIYDVSIDIKYGEYNYSDGIIFTKNIVIDGHGHKLDGNGLASILYVGGGKGHDFVNGVVLRNINFVNARNTVQTNKDVAFGALAIRGNASVENCNFSNNYAVCAAAMGIGYGTNIMITGCNFINNTGYGTGGGAIRLKTQVISLTISNCLFENNSGASYGGAVHSDKGLGNDGMIVDNCDFINNKANAGAGALFFQSPNGVLRNSRFVDNNANLGGALYWDGVGGTVVDCNFTHNNATEGGAIFCSNAGSTSISSSKFWNNTAADGGALYFKNNTVSAITTCYFYNNSASNQGGAVFCTGQFFRATYSNFTLDNAIQGGGLYLDVGAYVFNCNFNQSHAYDGGGIYLEAKIKAGIPIGVELGVISTNFTACHADNNGGAGYVYSDYGVVKDSILRDCTANNKGGAGYIWGSHGRLIDSQLIGNTALVNAGALYWEGNNGTIVDTIFRRNNATNDGGAVYWTGDNGTIFDCNFTNNRAIEGNGGSLLWNGSFGQVDNCYFNRSISKNNGGSAYISGNDVNITKSTFKYYNSTDGFGGALYIEGHNVNITHSAFEFGEAFKGGGIYIKGNDTYMLLSNLTHNHARDDAGIVYIEGDGTKIIKTNLKFSYSLTSGGGVYITGDHTWIDDSNLTFNNATENGGSIYLIGDDTNITNSLFEYCSANQGGAIYVEGSDARIKESRFSQNGLSPTAVYGGANGGAIFIAGHHTLVFKSNFTRQNAGNGGAIYITGDHANITESKFSMNIVRDNGGAIFVGGVNTFITQSTFNLTNATHGGAIYVNGNDTFIESNFSYTFAKNYSGDAAGGAIYVTGDNNRIFNSNFTITMAIGGNGGAIYAGGVNTTIDNAFCNISQAIRNGPGDRGSGGSIYIDGDYAKILNSRFMRFNSTDKGGSVYVAGDNANITHSYFGYGESTRGGIIYISGHNTYMEWCNLTRAHAFRYGGLMYIAGEGTIITDSKFDYAYSEKSGGSILITGGKNLITKSSFRYSNATDGWGGALFIDGDFNNITYSTFEQCSSTKGGAIFINGTDARVINSNFTRVGMMPGSEISKNASGGAIFIGGNNAYLSHDDFNSSFAYEGGFIYISGNGTEIKYSNFTQSSAYNEGGAIDIHGNNVLITESKFSKHGAAITGGTINVEGDDVNITNSNFAMTSVNSTANRTAGGAIYVGGNGVGIKNCKFNITTAVNGDGGAIYVEGNNANIVHSNFTISIADNGNGGAIYAGGVNTTIDYVNTTITNAIRKGPGNVGSGGSIYIEGDYAKLLNSESTRFFASDKGGALFIGGNNANVSNSYFGYGESTLGGIAYISGNDTNVEWCNLTRAHADEDGGLMYIAGNGTTITDSNFNYTYSQNSGGSIFIKGENNLITKSHFRYSNATDKYGGALFIEGGFNNITYSTFEQCSSKKGGAIYINGTDTRVTYSNFTRIGINPIYAVSEDACGGAIFIEGDNTYVSHGYFNLSVAYEGGFIFISGDNTKIKYSNFTQSTAYKGGGAIDIHGNSVLISQSSFLMHNATIKGGTINVEGYDVNITYSNFTLTSVSSTTNRTAGGAIFVGGNDVDIKYCKFNSTRAFNGDGGAIYVKGNNTDIQDSNFTRAYSYNGGAIYIEGEDAVVKHSEFITSYADNNGGAIYVEGGDAVIEYSTFEKHNATNGGTIYILGEGANVTNSNFTLTLSQNGHGGAIYIEGNHVNLIKSNFNLTSANNGNGGVIYVAGNNTNISGSSFDKSFAFDGGSIYILGQNSTIEHSNVSKSNATMAGGAIFITGNHTRIVNSLFERGNAEYGGAIYINGTDVHVHDSNFTYYFAKTDGGTFYIMGDYAHIGGSKIENSYSKRSGGAIYITGDYAWISGSTLNKTNSTNNMYDGGAIYVKGDYANITATQFEYSSSKHGGAIYIDGLNTTVEYCNFTKCNVNVDGGAIYINGLNAMVLNSNFTLNNATMTTNSRGGAIYVNGTDANIIGSRFEKSNARYGAAIYVSGNDAAIKKSTFNHSNVTMDGGAVYIKGENSLINDSYFNSSTANNKGGFIYIAGDYANISYSNFSRSVADKEGGAIFVAGANVSIEHSRFSYHNATDAGGALFVEGANTKIYHSFFEMGHSNSNNGKGGAVYLKATNTTIHNSTFFNNTSHNGGAIYNNGGTASVSDSNFTSNVAYNQGGSIFWIGGASNDVIAGSYFENNRALSSEYGFGGAIFWNNGDGTTFGAKIVNSTFYNNYAERHGGAIDWYHADDSVIENCNFTHNHAVCDGGALYVGDDKSDGKNLTISHCNFTDNYAGIRGGAISLQFYNSHVKHSLFINNTAAEGGTIFMGNAKSKNSEYVNCTFINSSTHEQTTSYSVTCNGGVAYILAKEIHFIDCRFYNSTVLSEKMGGAIYFTGDAEGAVIDGCEFINNTNASNGGAVYSKASNLLVNNSNFTQHRVSGNGGAIYLFSTAENITISNSRFDDNTALGSNGGGAIYVDSMHTLVNNSEFTNNSAKHGGAIYIAKSQNTIENSTFNKNNATVYEGGSIFIASSAPHQTLNKVTVANSTAKLRGGGIFIYALDVNITNSSIYGNLANMGGGIALLNANNTFIRDTNITNNNATSGSGIYAYVNGGKTTRYSLINVKLLENQANATEFTDEAIKRDANGSCYVTAVFRGKDNLLNGIWQDTGANAVEFTNVTYWDANGVTTTDSVPELSTAEAGINITVTKVKARALGSVVTTDENGAFKYYFEDTGDPEYKFTFEHFEDKYYTALSSSKSILATNVTIEIADIDFGQNATVNVTLTDRDGHKLSGIVRILINNTHNFTMTVTNGFGSVNNVSGLPAGLHNATVIYEGNANYLGSKNSTTFRVRGPVNITITKSVDLDNVSVGKLVNFTIEVYNSGESTANNVIITDTLPIGLTYISSGSNASHQGSMTKVNGVEVVTWNIGQLAYKAKVKVWVVVNATVKGNFSNVAVVNSTEGGQNSSNTTNITVNPHVNLTVIKTSNVTAHAYVGDLVNFTITVTNHGPSNATNVQIVDDLNPTFKFIKASDNNEPVNGRLTWTIGNISNGDSVSVWVVVKVMKKGTFTNMAVVNSTENTTSNATNITVDPLANLTITKYLNEDPDRNISVGELIKFVIVVKNNGPFNATNVLVTDELSEAFEFNSTNSSYTKYNQKIVWNITKLNVNEIYKIELVVKTVLNGFHYNVAIVNSTESENTTSNTTEVTVLPAVKLVIVKSSNITGNATIGDLANFTITVKNNGPSKANNITLSDTLNPAFEFIDAGGSYTRAGAHKVVWSIDHINKGDNVTVWVQVRLLTNGTFTNVAIANCSENKTNVSSNIYNLTVKPKVNLTIIKSSNGVVNASVGDLVNFTITVYNHGPSNATNVTIVDDLIRAFEFKDANGTYRLEGTRKVVWTIDHITNGSSTSVWVQVKLLTNGTFTNIATVNCNENKTNVTSNGTNVTVNPKVNLTAIKVVNVTGNVTVGDTIKFIITVINHGPSNATNVKVRDELNKAFEFVDASGNYVVAGRNVTWTIAHIENGTNASVWVQVRVLTNGTFKNVVAVNSTENYTTTEGETNVNVNPQVNLTVVKTSSLANANVGDLVNFTIVVTNNGLSNATSVNVTDFLPIGMIYKGAGANVTGVFVSNRILANGTHVVVWNIPLLANGSSVKLWVLVNVTANGTFTNVAFANSKENKTNSTNSTDITVNPIVDLVINKTVNKTVVYVNDLVEYTITVTNNGPSNATGVYVIDKLDVRLKLIQATPSQGTYDKDSGKWDINNITNGRTVTLTLLVRVLTNATIPNFANVTSNENDTNKSNNNVSSDNITVKPKVNLTVIKTTTVTDASVGDLVNFTIIVTNHGPSNATGVSVTDVLPIGMDYRDAGANVTGVAIYNILVDNKDAVEWQIPKIMNGTSVKLWILVNLTSNGTFTNVAFAVSNENSTKSTNSTNITVKPSVELIITKTVNKTDVYAGDIVEYTIEISNKGPSNATGVNVTDILDARLLYINSTATQGKYNATTHIWTINNITAGKKVTLRILVRILTNGTIPNIAFVNSTENTTNKNASSQNITAKPQVNLTVIKKADISNAYVGDYVNFTITVINNGLSNATNIVIVDELDQAFEYVASNGVNTAQKVTWTIGKLANGTNTSVWVQVKLLTNGTIKNGASANSTENTTKVTSNDTNITVNPKVNLTVVKTAGVTGTIYVGDFVNYTITVYNHGPSNATNVQIIDNLNPALKFVLANGTYTNNGQRVNWTIPFIANGTSASVWVQVRVLTNGTFSNVAIVNSTENETTSQNGTDITVSPQVNLTVIKTTVNAEANVWDLVNFTIVVTNNGLSNATDVNVTDYLPVGMTYKNAGANITGFSVSNTVLSNGTIKVVWNIPLLNNGSSVKLWVQVNLTTNGTFTNVAFATSKENKTNSTNSTDIKVNPVVDLIINKTVNKTVVYVNDLVEYTITVTNKGPSNATGVYVIDKLDTRLKLIQATPSQGTYDKDSGKWTIDNITNGKSVTLKLLVQALTNATIPNFANVTSNENDTNKSNNNVSSQNLTVKPKVNLTIIKYMDGNPNRNISVGDLVKFIIVVTNNGPSNATDVLITDVLSKAFEFNSTNVSYTKDNQKIQWNIGKLNNGSSFTIELVVKTVLNGFYDNVAIVNSTESENKTSNKVDVTVLPAVNLTLIKKSNLTANASVGDLVNFTIMVTNNGPSKATNVTVTDILPGQMQYVKSGGNVTGSNTTLPDGTTKVIWDIGNLTKGSYVELWVQVKVLANGTLTNIAFANSTENTTGTSNDCDINVSSVVDLVINKTVNKVVVLVGDIIEYNITVTNNGPSNATGVYVTDKLDKRLKLIKAIASQGTYDEATGKWMIDNITNGNSVILTLKVKVLANGTIPNFANVTSNENDTNKSNNNDSSDNVTANPKVILTVVKTSDVSGNAYVGDLIKFTITVTNNGPSNATNVEVVDELDSAFEYVGSNGNRMNQKVTWIIPFIANGTSKSVWVQVRILTNGTFKNSAVVNSAENKTTSQNSTDIVVKPVADLSVNKTVSKTNVSAGDSVVYTINVRNNGPNNATGVVVTENLKGSVEITAINPSKGKYNQTTHNWIITQLNAGETATLKLTVKVLKAETVENIVSVKADQKDTNESNNKYTCDNVTVNPLDTPIKLTTQNITYGEDETITVELPVNVTGSVNITVGNTTYPNRPINNGVVELVISDLAGGEYNVTVVYGGDDAYKGNSTNGTFKVSPRVPIIKIEVVDIWYGDVEVLNVTVNAPGFVNITVYNGVGTITAQLNHSVQTKEILSQTSFTPYDGKATWMLINLPVGHYPVYAIYLGNENYTSVNTTSAFNVRTLPSVVNVTADDIYVGEDAIIKVSVTPGATGNVTVDVEGQIFTVYLNQSKGQVVVPGLKAGVKKVKVKYNGDEVYQTSENSTEFTVKKIKPPISVGTKDIYVGENEPIVVKLPVDATGKVTITVDGKKYTADVVDGKATFNIKGLKAGTYDVKASYSGDDKYLPVDGEATFKVSKLKPDISIDSPDITVGEDGKVTVTLPDDATGTVTIEVDGKKYSSPVKDGKAVFKIPGLKVGKYDIKASYSGDDKYLPTTAESEMNVLPVDGSGNHAPKGLEKHATGNPLVILVVALMLILGVGFRKFKK